jgi:hypothetical protein
MRVQETQTVCSFAGVSPDPPKAGSKVGIALSSLVQTPVHGLRHRPVDGTNGWYIWCGPVLSSAPDFFSPLHLEHLDQYLPEARQYLDLPPGWRFMFDGNAYEDVWFDPTLIEETSI